MPAPARPNAYRIDGRVAYLDVATKSHPGAVTAIDEADLAIALDGRGRWYAYKSANRPQVYARRSITLKRGPHGMRGRQGYEMLHRVLAKTARRPIVMHRDYDGLNNRRSNLIAGTRNQMAVHARHAKSKYRGVFQRGKRYRSIIGIDGRVVHLGSFDTAVAAARAYDAVARKRYGALARLNFPKTKRG